MGYDSNASSYAISILNEPSGEFIVRVYGVGKPKDCVIGGTIEENSSPGVPGEVLAEVVKIVDGEDDSFAHESSQKKGERELEKADGLQSDLDGSVKEKGLQKSGMNFVLGNANRIVYPVKMKAIVPAAFGQEPFEGESSFEVYSEALAFQCALEQEDVGI